MITAILLLCIAVALIALGGALQVLRDVRSQDHRRPKAPCRCDTDRTACPIYRRYQ